MTEAEGSRLDVVGRARLLCRAWKDTFAPGLVLSLAIFGCLLWVNHAGQVFEFDPDEGNNVIKALLVREGYAYGTEIWTDQPPLFSYLLLPAFAALGATMDVARGVVSFASAALIFGLYEALRRTVGHLGSLTGVVLLLTSALYVPLSVSVMIGLPSVACLTLSLCLSALAGRTRARPTTSWLFALGAGVLAGAAIGIKLFGAPALIVLLSSAMLAFERTPETEGSVPRPAFREALKSASLRGLAFMAGLLPTVLLSLLPLLLAGTWSGLVETHQVARERASGDMDGLQTLLRFVTDDPLLFGLALFGTLVAVARRTLTAIPWLAWLLVASAALVDHSPVWPHHRLLLTVPAAALAAHAFSWRVPLSAPRGVALTFRFLAPAAALLASALGVSKEGRVEAMLHPAPWTSSAQDWKVFAEFSRYAEQSTLVAAARPTFAFRAGRPVPPNLAVTSWKRFRVGLLTNKQVAKDIADTKPQTILLSSRWPGAVRAQVEKKIKKTHRRVKRWSHQSSELWVEKALLDRMSAGGRTDAQSLDDD